MCPEAGWHDSPGRQRACTASARRRAERLLQEFYVKLRGNAAGISRTLAGSGKRKRERRTVPSHRASHAGSAVAAPMISAVTRSMIGAAIPIAGMGITVVVVAATVIWGKKEWRYPKVVTAVKVSSPRIARIPTPSLANENDAIVGRLYNRLIWRNGTVCRRRGDTCRAAHRQNSASRQHRQFMLDAVHFQSSHFSPWMRSRWRPSPRNTHGRVWLHDRSRRFCIKM